MQMCKVNTGQKSCSLDTIGIKGIPDLETTKKSYLRKRAAKALTKAAMHKLFALESPINDDYRQAYMCNEYLFQNGSKVTSNYCSKKCCTVCSRIKSAQNLAKYGDRILELKDLHLVTLTDKNVLEMEDLEENVKQMYDALARIKRNINKNYKELKINGFRSFECTYSFKTGFNPHFHFIVEGKASAELLVQLWLKQFPTADRRGQDIRPVQRTKKSLLEVFKYIAKPITKGYYSARAYDAIMIVAKQHRVTDPLGKIRYRRGEESPGDLNLDDLKSQEIRFKESRFEVWKYVHELYDYVAPTGELLLDTPLDSKTKNAINVIERSKAEPGQVLRSETRILYENRVRDGSYNFE